MGKIKNVKMINQSRALLVANAFSNICNSLKEGANEEDLKSLMFEGIEEVAFREFLEIIKSVDWDETLLKQEEVNVLNLIGDYLNDNHKQKEQEVVVSAGVSFLDVIKEKENEKK